MTGMEHAIEQAAKVADDILSADPQVAREMFGDEPDKIARALAEAGLLAPAPLTEEWGAEMDHPIQDRPPSTIKARDLENARWQVEHNPKVATGRIMRRYVTDWEEA